MIFESAPSNEMGFLVAALAKYKGSEMKDGLLKLPEAIGKGYIKSVDLGLLKIMVHQYELKKDVTLKKTGVNAGENLITFSFRNVFYTKVKKNSSNKLQHRRLLPSVLLSSGDIDLEIFTPAGTEINAIIITVHIDLLKDLLNKKEENTLLQTIISGKESYLYEEISSPEIQNVAMKIVEANTSEQLGDFYLKLKAEEMIYLFFVELLKRQTLVRYPLNVSDAKVMYSIRDKLISDLSVPPNIQELVLFANMSESKMNRLFKQIFGSSIYNYYQTLRIKEAAYLIKEEKLSVSEAGYRLGFTNLSHFTRIFERHIGFKPKKYSAK
ncbi:MAG TPA: AraC family transcriptional regulator [Cytophagaceae bacterium]|jgi:AraC-like DNA-binding protein|nr:AraC family transcriptional regulator [Cytophagaceae bacterium]